ncbi:sulfotransferase [Ruegeria sp. 2205SS24-7]|uniref:sulfotransferase n=1 Tax=Ruegeria discodermiae TaxID=3064389 RepID=UPI00274087B9|nr:sulfotransferase [Ruegeria sp. 2205SS24-7]MDP5220283.1 sulfotransferase [Ruegeria sp. 2205SS24-7]
MTRFLIVGQPRSGTTYVQTLLSSHPDILCRGEMFDPYQIDDSGRKNKNLKAIWERDANPGTFLERMLAGEGLSCAVPPVMGIKVLHHHNPSLMKEIIPANPDLRLIHVLRANKLAQFASARQVQLSGRWTASSDTGEAPLVKAGPFWAASECNRLENEDFLFSQWISTLPNPSLTLEYSRMHRRDTLDQLTRFLGVGPSEQMASPLRKQGQNNILDRFADPEPIAAHFRATGRGAWLGLELDL